MKRKIHFPIVLVAGLVFGFSLNAFSQTTSSSAGLSIEKAVMCESIENFLPKTVSAVFSISIGKVVCYSAFDSVPNEMAVYHNWYRKDQLSTKRRLTLKPPKWSAFSEIQLREADRGPWRVEITDETGNILRILRFSITD